MPKRNRRFWGSDVIATALQETGTPYLVINPGGSYRGLHDSVVNFLELEGPDIVMCLHEEHAAAIAHGYAMVEGRPLAVAVHSNVGLMHASMAIFNAWCARCPMIVLSATGPTDAAARRPWIDWIHSSADHGALVRNYTKWDDQPASVPAAVESIRRATIATSTEPVAPVLINLDTALQEDEIDDWPDLPSMAEYCAPGAPSPSPADLERARALLNSAERPVILVGRVSRSQSAWNDRIALAERIGARVITSVGTGAGFPTNHPLYAAEAAFSFTGELYEIVNNADVVLSLDWRDLGGTLKTLWPFDENLPRIISCSMDHHLANGWSMDYYGLAPAQVHIGTTADAAVTAFLDALPDNSRPVSPSDNTAIEMDLSESADGHLRMADLAIVFNEITAIRNICLINRPIRWPIGSNLFDHPLAYLGDNGGGGLGAGPGMAVGAALAIRDHHPDRLPVAIIGDGDFLMASSALWTAAKYDIPLLMIVANNHSYFADEVLQENVARHRDRSIANKSIGVAISDPNPDIPGLARSFGFDAPETISTISALRNELKKAVEIVRDGGRLLLDVEILPESTEIFTARTPKVI